MRFFVPAADLAEAKVTYYGFFDALLTEFMQCPVYSEIRKNVIIKKIGLCFDMQRVHLVIYITGSALHCLWRQR